ncbi:MAG: hypothetical protein EBZ77_08080, partial [Chitinophagia bacterium]|nr:hypothetical protein [Chitinophagia bacterium]
MSFRITLLMLAGLVANWATCLGQDVSYTAHKKYFYLCAYQKECTYCESCSKDVYKVRIKNNTDKRITSVFYQYYSPLNERTITNEARIQGEMLEGNGIGNIYVCIKGKTHWAITKIVYSDNSEV